MVPALILFAAPVVSLTCAESFYSSFFHLHLKFRLPLKLKLVAFVMQLSMVRLVFKILIFPGWRFGFALYA